MGIRILHPDEIEARFNLAQQAFIASMNGSEEHATAKAQMAEDVPSLRKDWTYALAWALFPTRLTPLTGNGVNARRTRTGDGGTA